MLKDILDGGQTTKAHKGATKELIARSFILSEPRDRCLLNQVRMFPIYYAVGHWLWIMGGKYDLPSIEYYSSKASKFSADLRKLDGAYGYRLFGPGTKNQIPHLVSLISDRGETRRAVATVYDPDMDSYRVAVDGREDEIPCTIALQYLPRGNKLHAITYMRSQNALDILPYDVFIFTLLQEYVAASCSLQLGEYHHFAGSFHYYCKEEEFIRAIITDVTSPSVLMPEMSQGSQENDLKEVLKIEEQVRNYTLSQLAVPGKQQFNIRQFYENAVALSPFWCAIVDLLLAWASFKVASEKWLDKINERIPKPLDAYVRRSIELISKSKGRALETYDV